MTTIDTCMTLIWINFVAGAAMGYLIRYLIEKLRADTAQGAQPEKD